MSRLVVFGDTLSARIHALNRACKSHDIACVVLDYRDVIEQQLKNDFSLSEWLKPDDWLRIESPGGEHEIARGLVELGSDAAHGEGRMASRFRSTAYSYGQIWFPRQFFLGFKTCVKLIGDAAGQIPNVRFMNDPSEILIMFDKEACHGRLEAAGIAVPPSIPKVNSYDQLISEMAQRNWTRVFIKLATGSSASGVVALQVDQNGKVATTSVELVNEDGDIKLFNSLKIRRYQDEGEIEKIVNILCGEKVHVERWLPKASLSRNTVFDTRIVCVGGRPAHRVLRQSKSPLTNLHLGNERVSFEKLCEADAGQVGKIEMTCRNVAKCFPGAFYFGSDILVTPGMREHYVLEVNSLGDFLPNLEFEGLGTYELELASWKAVNQAP